MAEYMLWLADQGYREPRKVDARRWAAIRRKLFTWSIELGRLGDCTSVDNCYCYESLAQAKAALDAWAAAGFKSEPEGWHRNPNTGRRRPHGDKAREYLAW